MTTSAWRKSSRSGGNGGQCIEVRVHVQTSEREIRDSKNKSGPTLTLHAAAFGSFVDAIKAGHLDA